MGRFPTGRESDVVYRRPARLDGFCSKFDEELWTALLDYVTVDARDDIRFAFKVGNEVKVSE